MTGDNLYFTPPKGASPEYPVTPIEPGQWRDGIIVRSPNWLGDAAMALPAMCCLKEMLPDYCGFFVAAPDNLIPFYEAIPWVDLVVPLGSGHSSWNPQAVWRVARITPGVGFLFVNSFRSAWYFRRARVRKLYGAANGLRNLLLTRSFPVKWHEREGYAKGHQAYSYVAMAKALGAKDWDGRFPEFRIDGELECTPPELTEFLTAGKLLAVAPGAAYGPSKRWPAERFNAVCRWWVEERGGNVLSLGAGKEREAAEAAVSGLPPDRARCLAGKTSLASLMRVLAAAERCVANDSGVMHLAAALGKTGVAVFGSTDPFATGPLGGRWAVLLERQSCAPCFSRECRREAPGYQCLAAVSPEMVVKTLERTLAAP